VNGNTLTQPLYAELKPTSIGDYDSDGLQDLMVKFNRKVLVQLVNPGYCTLTLRGKLTDGTAFQGSDSVKVIH
jgi:hypothetical protein